MGVTRRKTNDALCILSLVAACAVLLYAFCSNAKEDPNMSVPESGYSGGK